MDLAASKELGIGLVCCLFGAAAVEEEEVEGGGAAAAAAVEVAAAAAFAFAASLLLAAAAAPWFPVPLAPAPERCSRKRVRIRIGGFCELGKRGEWSAIGDENRKLMMP